MAPEFRGKISPLISRRTLVRNALIAAFLVNSAGQVAQAAATSLGLWQPGAGGKKPPLFKLPDISGQDVSLGAKRGAVTLVHFWATWCDPCRDELPALRRLSERSGSELNILAISVAEPDSRVRRFIDATPLPFPVLLDRDKAVARAWDVTTLPTTFVLDANLQPGLHVDTDFAWDTVSVAQLRSTLAQASQDRAARDRAAKDRSSKKTR